MSIRIAIKHHTAYHYDRAVVMSPHVVRLRPAPHTRGTIESYSLNIAPSDHFLNWQQDPFGNYIARLAFPEKVRDFTVDVEVVADMVAINPFDFFLDEDAKKYPFNYAPLVRDDLNPYLKRIQPGPLLAKWIDSVDTSPRNTIDFLVDLNRRLADDVAYTVRMEPGVQSCEHTLESGTGSCRDSAWLLAQITRHFGIASRFVSGYLVQLVADQIPVDGPAGPSADFTDLHAWTEVYLPGAGWVGLDPTSGLLAGEGHIPLACTPHYATAAPIEGATEKCDVEFSFGNEIRRIHEDPRVTKPYRSDEWEAITFLGDDVDKRLEAADVRLTMGGEPTFVATYDVDDPQWNTDALGEEKLRLAERLLWKLRSRFASNSLVHHGLGKWYPGEQLPRWAMSLYWRKDGVPVWTDDDLLANHELTPAYATEAQAASFITELAETIGVDPTHSIDAYEDVYYYLWREGTLPVNVDPFDSRLEDELERARLLKVFSRGLDTLTGYALPLTPTADGWQSGEWPLRRERLYLIPGDSPMGFRLPLPSLPFVPTSERATTHSFDPFHRSSRDGVAIPFEPRWQRAEESDAERSSLNHDFRAGPYSQLPAYLLPALSAGQLTTALCTEVRDGIMHVFMPPVAVTEKYLELVNAIEQTAAKLAIPVIIEGYQPPADHRFLHLSVTPDPGVIEVNVHPAKSWRDHLEITDVLYDEAIQTRLGTEKFMLDGSHSGTGGGNHVVLGGETPDDSPFLRNPNALKSLITFWQNHPSLSYLFSGLFIGPTSQAPRVDEARDENLYELETALGLLDRSMDHAMPWIIDRALRNHLIDLTGNTHRAEFCIDKLYSPDGPGGRRGLVEFRAFEMPPHAQMSAAQVLLLRALVSRFWSNPYPSSLIRFGTALHDRFMLPHYVWTDFLDVMQQLNEWGYPFQAEWYRPFFEFRFPKLGEVASRGMQLSLRKALEPWHVLGEESSNSGTSRYVDSSAERIEIMINGFVPERYAVAANGYKTPMRATGTSGEFVGGVRFKAWDPASAMHPTAAATPKVTIDVVDQHNDKSVFGCMYFVSHPGGMAYEHFPVNAREAQARRLSRFWPQGHSQGTLRVAEPIPSPEFPYTLDLRRQS